MQQGISLPPQVQGSSIKGDLDLIFGSLNWTSTTKPRPQHLFARILWWGDASATTHDIPLYHSRDSQTNVNSIRFPLVSSAAHIARYLNDMTVLEIIILHAEAAPKAIAKVSINTAAIADTGLATFNSEAVPVVALQTGIVLGSLQIKFDINYRPPPRFGFSAPDDLIKSRESVGQEVATALESLNIMENMIPVQENQPLDSSLPIASASVTIPEHQNLAMDLEHSSIDQCDTLGTEALSPTSRATGRKKEKDDDGGGNGNVIDVATEVNIQDDIDQMKMQTTSQHDQYYVRVKVDSAFELLLPSQQQQQHAQSRDSSVYASVVWQRDRSQRVHTHLTGSQEVPFAVITGTTDNEQQHRHAAVWRSDLELKVNIEPFAAAATDFFSRDKNISTGLLEGPLLLINVWESGIMPNKDPVALLEQLQRASSLSSQKEAAVSTPFDQLLGCAAVDLSPFVHQTQPTNRQIEGRFPLVNAQHQVQGFVKACVSPKSHLNAALDGLCIPPKYDGEAGAAGGDFNFTRISISSENRVQQSQRGGRKQEYAWSGSDSDDDGDGMGMVGVCFDGAVSCSDGEEDQQGDGDSSVIGGDFSIHGNRDEIMEIEGDRKKASGISGLITHDWMFDISKNVQGHQEKVQEEEEKEDGKSGSGFYFCQQEQVEEEEDEEAKMVVSKEKKKPVVFKNKLLPGVVVSPRKVTPYVWNASEFANGGRRVSGDGGNSPTYQDAALPILPPPQQQQQPSLPPQTRHIAHHHPGLHSDWLFGIQQQQQQKQQQPQSQNGRQSPPEVSANQFAPMARPPK
jgi:hypothetical protein